MDPTFRLLSYSEAAKLLTVSEITLRRWVSQRRIPHKKIGRSVRFDLDELTAWIDKQSVPVGGQK